MFNGNASPSLADIAAVTGNGRNNDGMWGGDGWWAIIIFAMIFGWGGFGGNGWGGNGGMGATASAYTDSAIQRGFDTQATGMQTADLRQREEERGEDMTNLRTGT